MPDSRLNHRYLEMVKGHFHHSSPTATGVAVPVSASKSLATTQATWRFFNNDRVTPLGLVEPLRHFARHQLAGADYALAVIDWCKLDYKKHTAKKDIVRISHEQDIGYELTTHLLVSAENGCPLAPIQMHLKTANGYLSTAETVPASADHHLPQVLPLMREAAAMELPTTLVHVIDREADSVFHLREWDTAGFSFLIRGKDWHVRWRDELVKYSTIEARLEAEGAFRPSREVSIKGKSGVQYVAEVDVVLDRPATSKVNGRVVSIPGEAIALRLVMAKVVDPKTGEVLSTWYLLTNVPSEVPAERIALWYYWRWKIESFFKLMKSGGQEVEHWQQESGEAVLKRLLVASMACTVVWSLQRDESSESVEFKQVLVRLSGKRLKRGRPPTEGTLFSGLFVWLRIWDFLTERDYDLEKITKIKTNFDNCLPRGIKDV